MHNSITFAAVGDSLAIARINAHNPELQKLREYITSCDIAITNLEAVIHEFEQNIYPSRISGGDWVSTGPDTLSDLAWLGFNLYALPNNHSFDWMCNGISKTIENLKKHNIIFSGIGNNLYEASKPAYFQAPEGRVALISITTTFEEWHRAGKQRHDTPGRPGVNGVGYQSVCSITNEEMAVLKQITEKYPVGSVTDNDGHILFGGILFDAGDRGVTTRVNSDDKNALGHMISLAARQADLVIVSCHSHESKNGDPFINADFQEELARFCIDCGANAYIGHGPHVIRGIEIYKDSPIFYSLGNFFYQCELIEREPDEFYNKFKPFGPEACTADVFDYRIEAGGILGEINPDYYRSVIAKFKICDKKLSHIDLVPVSLNYSCHRSLKGTPKIADKNEASIILKQIQRLSEPYGTKIQLIDDRAHIIL